MKSYSVRVGVHEANEVTVTFIAGSIGRRMMPSLRVQPDGGPPVDLTPGGSVLRWVSPGVPADSAADLLPLVISRLRLENRQRAARETSLAITHCQDAEHALQDGDTVRALTHCLEAVRWLIDRERRLG